MSAAMRWSIVVAGETVLVLFLLTFGNTFTGAIVFHRLQLLILAIVGGIGWLTILHRPNRVPALLLVAPLPLLASLAITSIWSRYPSLSSFATWQCAAYVGIAWLLAIQAGHPAGRRNLVAVMGIVAILVIGVYMVVAGFAWAEWLQLGFPVSTLPLRPLGDGGLVQLPTWVGDVLALCTPAVAVWMWSRNARAGAIALTLVASAAIVISGTRSVILLAVVMTVVAATVLVRDRIGPRTALVASLIATAAVVIGLGVILLAGRSFDEGRTSAYMSAIARFRSSPLVGTGPGTYGALRMGDAVDGLAHLAVPDAHNIFLTAAAESGIAGLLGLGMSVGSYALAIRQSWVSGPSRRLMVVAILGGVSVVAGHAMGEVVFALVGIIVLVLAAISIAATDTDATAAPAAGRSWRLDLALLGGVAIVVVSSIRVIGNETTLDTVAEADGLLPTSPAAALVAARRATDASPDIVPAWWVRMVAADAAGDVPDALMSARQTVALEGFSQEWLSFAGLLARSGDVAGARDALVRASSRSPFDPVVVLNAAISQASSGDEGPAVISMRRLLSVQPDIEPILRDAPAALSPAIARARAQAAADFMDAGSTESALLVALYGEDQALADALIGTTGMTSDEPTTAYWAGVVRAWFGDRAARAAHDASATAQPTSSALTWSWRLAAHACDPSGADHWARSLEILSGSTAAVPTMLGEAPLVQFRMLPSSYPGVVWRTDHPDRPYVAGIWTFVLDRPACAR